jgi:hypothetical protein
MFQIGGKLVGPFLVIWNYSNLLPTDLFRLVTSSPNVTGELIPENLLYCGCRHPAQEVLAGALSASSFQ